MGEQENLNYTKSITDFLGKALQVAPDRLFIHFHDMKAHEASRGGLTYKTLWDKK